MLFRLRPRKPATQGKTNSVNRLAFAPLPQPLSERNDRDLWLCYRTSGGHKPAERHLSERLYLVTPTATFPTPAASGTFSLASSAVIGTTRYCR